MKQRAYFRIICLKNEDNKKYIDEKSNKNNIILTNNGNPERNSSQDIIPNIVHLSARIQNDALQDQNNPYSNRQPQQPHTPEHHFKSDNIFLKKKEVEEKRQSFIKRYLESKHTSLSKQKHTMKNLIGQVTFSTNKKRQKRISKLIKQTLDQASLSKRIKKTKLIQDPYSQSLLQNRLSLQEDFNTFLLNKQKQFIRELQPKLQDTEQYKLKKLLITNPEREEPSHNTSTQKHLNLFHFVSSGKEKGMIPRIKPRIISSSNSKEINPAWSRIDRRLLKNSNLKTQQQQFEWSRIKGSNPRSFIFKTINT